MHFHTLYAISRHWLWITLCFYILYSATVLYKYSVKDNDIIQLMAGNPNICALQMTVTN